MAFHSVLSIKCGRRKKKVLKIFTFIFCLITTVVLLIIVNGNPQKWYTKFNDKSMFIDTWPSNNSYEKPSQLRLILFWTLFFNANWDSFYDSIPKIISNCEYKCTFTYDKKLVKETDMIIFNARDVFSKYELDKNFPQLRYPHQIWMLHNTEPPWLTYLDLSHYNNVFNWTSFVRSDSEVPAYYGRREIVRHQNITTTIEHNDTVLSKSTTYKQKENILSKKPRFAVWAASNCYSVNGREHFVAQLQQYIAVDTFGSCGTMQCKRYSSECANVMKLYKYYFSFENSNCKDYITEKLWTAYEYGAIPVVMGGTNNYEKYAPPGSYINVADFKSAKHLAKFLLDLSNDSERYNGYFDWRKDYKITQTYWCDLCTKLHQWNGSRQSYRDLHGWHIQDTCMPWSVSTILYF